MACFMLRPIDFKFRYGLLLLQTHSETGETDFDAFL